MKVAFISTIRNDWASASRLLSELKSALQRYPDFESSIWLVDDGSTMRPPSWNALATANLEAHVIELQGSHGSQRSLSAALGFLECELEGNFDGYVLVPSDSTNKPGSISTLLDTAARYPGSVIAAEPLKNSGAWLTRVSRVSQQFLFRLSTGTSMKFGTLLFIPKRAAEILCHSSYAGNHLGAAIYRLGLPRIGLPAQEFSAHASSFSMPQCMAAASVFRDVVFARAFMLLSGACAFLAAAIFALVILHFAKILAISASILAGLLLAFFFCLSAAVVVLVLSLNSSAVKELRAWTPALDSSSLVRSVHRVRREPYGIAGGHPHPSL
jgi:hypothetical protein